MMAEDRVRGLPVQTSRHGHTRTGLRSVCGHSHTDALEAQAIEQVLLFFYSCIFIAVV